MAEAQQEKRATRRFALRLPVAVTYAENGTQERSAQTRDVSARGISFYVDSPIATGSPIEFTLTLPAEITLTESIRVRCKGTVVRLDDGVGALGPQPERDRVPGLPGRLATPSAADLARQIQKTKISRFTAGRLNLVRRERGND